MLELIVRWLFWMIKHANKGLFTSNCHFNTLKSHLLECLIVQNNHSTMFLMKRARHDVWFKSVIAKHCGGSLRKGYFSIAACMGTITAWKLVNRIRADQIQRATAFSMSYDSVLCVCARVLARVQSTVKLFFPWGVPSDNSPNKCIPSPVPMDTPSFCELSLMGHASFEKGRTSGNWPFKAVSAIIQVGASGGHFVNDKLRQDVQSKYTNKQTQSLYSS